MRWALLVIVVATIPAAPASTRLSGYAKSYLVATSDIAQSQNSVRVMVERLGEKSAFQDPCGIKPRVQFPIDWVPEPDTRHQPLMASDGPTAPR
ncbi:MAG: hypothetical protein U5O39_13690 [Gammaproteobacteria bacterium]|nr:hypothetical protein [Gammaproteobacteria bacterium]